MTISEDWRSPAFEPPREERMTTRVCEWSRDEDGDWQTECGKMFILVDSEMFIFIHDAGPRANGFVHCPYCGGRLREAAGGDDA